MIYVDTRKYAEILLPGDSYSLREGVTLDGVVYRGRLISTYPVKHEIGNIGIVKWDMARKVCCLHRFNGELIIELRFRETTMLSFTKQGNLYLAHSDRFKDVVGSGMSKTEAEADFHHRVANGWHEERRAQLIRAIRAGLTAREQLARTGEERARIDADRSDLENFIRMIARNDLIAITES